MVDKTGIQISDRIRIARKKATDFTQKQMADRLGINETTYLRYEKGERIPNVELIVRFIDITGVDAMWLLTGKGDMYPATDSVRKDELTTDDFIDILAPELSPVEKLKFKGIIEELAEDKVMINALPAFLEAIRQKAFSSYYNGKKERQKKVATAGGNSSEE